jgi:hypothetical protein
MPQLQRSAGRPGALPAPGPRRRLEKATGSSQSDPLAALYQLLEPERACAFRDEFIDVDIDASQIF